MTPLMLHPTAGSIGVACLLHRIDAIIYSSLIRRPWLLKTYYIAH